jgi:predicted RNA-binding Zn ribbon-like protein
MEPVGDEDSFEFSGGALCLDFANTLGDRPRACNETLHAHPDLLRWGVAAGLLDPGDQDSLARRARRRPGESAAGFERAIALRESLYRIFSARVSGRAPDRSDLDVLNEHLRPALTHLALEADEAGFHWDWTGSPEPADRLLWSVARSAAELLTSAELDRIRECASDRCGWLFLDHSRSRRRRWCDMKTCGNRAKARRHYLRRKARGRRQGR